MGKVSSPIANVARILGRFQKMKRSEEVKCSLPRGKSLGEDGSSKSFMSEWEHDVVFGFVEWTFKE
ncbi:hypothetical protein CsSME_00000827 [Camellia sinensis var. sinensis]